MTSNKALFRAAIKFLKNYITSPLAQSGKEEIPFLRKTAAIQVSEVKRAKFRFINKGPAITPSAWQRRRERILLFQELLLPLLENTEREEQKVKEEKKRWYFQKNKYEKQTMCCCRKWRRKVSVRIKG
ncbi:hypothetical protein CEXT_239311 [Caerostris extrusa]|uniref:Uncharacterized protein n=1 Tax=Caerostris extrusa TaxID=172846 RepID=A0AAV4QXZ4_CAEEX|nr:hypothetical protein CEXT_239311 [Caerostris extrusa]